MATEDDSYGARFARGNNELTRLNVQHNTITRAVGYLVHPIAAPKLVSGCKVADVGTGTGVFLRELAQQVNNPSIELHGFDISATQFPPKEQLASNISLKIADIKKGFPEQYHGQYDIVHMRYLYVAMQSPQDWRDTAKNVMALLKPGGYLQWFEASFFDCLNPLCAVPGGDPEFNALLLETYNYFIKSTDSLMPASWSTENLSSLLKEAGAESVRQDVTSTDRVLEDRKTMTEIQIDVFVTFAVPLAKSGMEGAWDLETVLEKHRRLREIAREGKVYLRYNIHGFIARKPKNGNSNM